MLVIWFEWIKYKLEFGVHILGNEKMIWTMELAPSVTVMLYIILDVYDKYKNSLPAVLFVYTQVYVYVYANVCLCLLKGVQLK